MGEMRKINDRLWESVPEGEGSALRYFRYSKRIFLDLRKLKTFDTADVRAKGTADDQFDRDSIKISRCIDARGKMHRATIFLFDPEEDERLPDEVEISLRSTADWDHPDEAIRKNARTGTLSFYEPDPKALFDFSVPHLTMTIPVPDVAMDAVWGVLRDGTRIETALLSVYVDVHEYEHDGSAAGFTDHRSYYVAREEFYDLVFCSIAIGAPETPQAPEPGSDEQIREFDRQQAEKNPTAAPIAVHPMAAQIASLHKSLNWVVVFLAAIALAVFTKR
jgi:hypothetical protein